MYIHCSLSCSAADVLYSRSMYIRCSVFLKETMSHIRELSFSVFFVSSLYHTHDVATCTRMSFASSCHSECALMFSLVATCNARDVPGDTHRRYKTGLL